MRSLEKYHAVSGPLSCCQTEAVKDLRCKSSVHEHKQSDGLHSAENSDWAGFPNATAGMKTNIRKTKGTLSPCACTAASASCHTLKLGFYSFPLELSRGEATLALDF